LAALNGNIGTACGEFEGTPEGGDRCQGKLEDSAMDEPMLLARFIWFLVPSRPTIVTVN
jgi:hypothetical protein